MDLSRCHEGAIPPQALSPAGSFRFGNRSAAVASSDPGFRERFLSLFKDCQAPAGVAADGAPPVTLDVLAPGADGIAFAQLSEHADDFDAAVVERLLGLQLVAAAGASPGWRAFARRDTPSVPVLAAKGGRVAIAGTLPWQMLAAHYFLHHVLRLQPGMVFLHGATVVVGGRAVFIGGAKGAGKSTLALALAARGHGFLGDEVAAIECASAVARPLPRAVSIRRGPQAQGVAARLAAARPAQETLPDGTTRVRVAMSELFPGALVPAARLTHALLLRGFGERPAAERCEMSREDLHLAGALQSMFAGRSPGGRVVDLLQLFARLRCHRVTVGGTPDEMVALIEAIAEDRWDTASSKEPRASERFAG